MNTICQYYYDNHGNKLAHGFYIEIGAFNGTKQNSTIVLEQFGWVLNQCLLTYED